MNGDLEVLKLNYEKWYSKKANSRYRGQKIEIRPANFWNTRFSIFKNDREVGLIRFNWKGEAIIRLDELVEDTREYVVRSRWALKPHFDVYLDTGELLLTFRAISKWHACKIVHEVKRKEAELPVDEYELLLYCGFAANTLSANHAAGV